MHIFIPRFDLLIRLTAFVLKSFAQSRGFVYIDPLELSAAKDWIILHQKKDGSFPAMGRILNKDIQVSSAHGKTIVSTSMRK